MNENIKNIISSKIKYHSNKQKYGYFIGNDCIDICASDILDDVIKADYRKQSDTVKDFAERLKKECHKAIAHNDKAMGNREKVDEMWYICSGQNDGLDFVLKTMNELAEQYGKEE